MSLAIVGAAAAVGLAACSSASGGTVGGGGGNAASGGTIQLGISVPLSGAVGLASINEATGPTNIGVPNTGTGKIGDSVVMAADDCTGHPTFGGFSLSLIAKDVAEAEKCFAALEVGGQVKMPLSATFFSPKFGMLTDRFGVGWMVMVSSA